MPITRDWQRALDWAEIEAREAAAHQCKTCHGHIETPDPKLARHIGDETWNYCSAGCRMASYTDWTR